MTWRRDVTKRWFDIRNKLKIRYHYYSARLRKHYRVTTGTHEAILGQCRCKWRLWHRSGYRCWLHQPLGSVGSSHQRPVDARKSFNRYRWTNRPWSYVDLTLHKWSVLRILGYNNIISYVHFPDVDSGQGRMDFLVAISPAEVLQVVDPLRLKLLHLMVSNLFSDIFLHLPTFFDLFWPLLTSSYLSYLFWLLMTSSPRVELASDQN